MNVEWPYILIMCRLPCIINDDNIFLSFDKDLHGQSSCQLYMAFQLFQNIASGHIKVKKRTGHVFYVPTPSHATESVVLSIQCHFDQILAPCNCCHHPWCVGHKSYHKALLRGRDRKDFTASYNHVWLRWHLIPCQLEWSFPLPHVIAKHIEGRVNNVKKPTNTSRSPCINQWDILTIRWAGWILCVTCWRNRITWSGSMKRVHYA